MSRGRPREQSIVFDKTLSLCYPFPLRPGYLAQIVVPRDMTADEAARLCAFVKTLAQDLGEPNV